MFLQILSRKGRFNFHLLTICLIGKPLGDTSHLLFPIHIEFEIFIQSQVSLHLQVSLADSKPGGRVYHCPSRSTAALPVLPDLHQSNLAILARALALLKEIQSTLVRWYCSDVGATYAVMHPANPDPITTRSKSFPEAMIQDVLGLVWATER